MKVALIGRGRWGQVLLKELKEQAEIKYECDSTTDLGQVFADPEIAAVFIATPIPTHYAIAMRALEAGKHVFLEKPGSENSTDLEKLNSLAKAKNLKFAVGYEFVHQPGIQKLKELMEGQTVEFIRLEWQKWGSFKYGIEKNLLCHDISILKYLGIELNSPAAYRTGFVTEADLLATRFGKTAMSVINRVSPVKSHTILAKLSGRTYLWSDPELFEVIDQELKKIEISSVSAVAAELADFLSSITENREPLANGDFALEVYRVIERV